jgi:hypothetical protein
MRIAISTNSLSTDTTAALQRAAVLGFAWVEINLQSAEFSHESNRTPDLRFYRRLREHLDTLNLSVWSVTTPPDNAQETSATARIKTVYDVASVAGSLGAHVVVTEADDLFSNSSALQPYFDGATAPPVNAGYDEVWVQIVNRRMKLALHNGATSNKVNSTNDIDRMVKITHDLAIHMALDESIATMHAPLRTWLAALSDRIAVAYVDDNQADWPTLPNATSIPCIVLRGAATDSAEHWHNRLEQLTQHHDRRPTA